MCFYVWCLLSCRYTKDLVSHILYTTKIILSKNISATTWIFWWRVINEFASNLLVFSSLTVLAKQFADLAKQSRLIKFTSRRCLGLIKFWTKTALNTEIVFFPICTSYWKPPINSFQQNKTIFDRFYKYMLFSSLRCHWFHWLFSTNIFIFASFHLFLFSIEILLMLRNNASAVCFTVK